MAGTSDTTATEIEEFRWAEFMNMGFSDHDALVLALAKGDNGWPLSVHKVRKALGGGCSLKLAMQIFGPLELDEGVVLDEFVEQDGS